MTTVFVVVAVVGFGLLLLSFVLDDFLDGVFDAINIGDIGGDLDGGGLLSTPVVGAFLGAAGVGGALVANATDEALLPALAGAAVGGVVLGFVALRLSRAFIDMPTDPSLRSDDFMGEIGKVITPIAGGRGEVMLRVGGAPQKLTARSDHDIERGDEVVVIEVLSSSSVRVIPFTEILEDPSS